MLFDRISLVDAYGALKIVESNEGKLAQILFNKTAYYGTKTVVRFGSVQELRRFIETEFKFQLFDPNCECGVCNESIWTLLSFTVELPDRRYISFVNNMRGQFESAEGAYLNKTSIDALAEVFKKKKRLALIRDKYECFGYIQTQSRYVNPCEYIEVIKNDYYLELFDRYKATKGIHGLTASEVFVDKCHEGVIVKKKVWTTTTTTADPCVGFDLTDTSTTPSGTYETTTTSTTTTSTTTTTEAPTTTSTTSTTTTTEAPTTTSTTSTTTTTTEAPTTTSTTSTTTTTTTEAPTTTSTTSTTTTTTEAPTTTSTTTTTTEAPTTTSTTTTTTEAPTTTTSTTSTTTEAPVACIDPVDITLYWEPTSLTAIKYGAFTLSGQDGNIWVGQSTTYPNPLPQAPDIYPTTGGCMTENATYRLTFSNDQGDVITGNWKYVYGGFSGGGTTPGAAAIDDTVFEGCFYSAERPFECPLNEPGGANPLTDILGFNISLTDADGVDRQDELETVVNKIKTHIYNTNSNYDGNSWQLHVECLGMPFPTTTTTSTTTSTTSTTTTTTEAPTTTSTTSTTSTTTEAPTTTSTTTEAPVIIDPINTDLQIWFDGADISQFQPTNPSDGGTITQWNDKSAIAHNANPTGGSISVRPSYEVDALCGKSGVYFDGSDGLSINPITELQSLAGMTVFVVLRFSNTVSQQTVYKSQNSDGTTGDLYLFRENTGQIFFNFTNGGSNLRQTQSPVITDTNAHLITMTFNGNSTDDSLREKLWIDGVSVPLHSTTTVGSTTPSNLSTLFVGINETLNSHMNGYIFEMLMFDRELTLGERTSVESQLTDKWFTNCSPTTTTTTTQQVNSIPLAYNYSLGSGTLYFDNMSTSELSQATCDANNANYIVKEYSGTLGIGTQFPNSNNAASNQKWVTNQYFGTNDAPLGRWVSGSTEWIIETDVNGVVTRYESFNVCQ